MAEGVDTLDRQLFAPNEQWKLSHKGRTGRRARNKQKAFNAELRRLKAEEKSENTRTGLLLEEGQGRAATGKLRLGNQDELTGTQRLQFATDGQVDDGSITAETAAAATRPLKWWEKI